MAGVEKVQDIYDLYEQCFYTYQEMIYHYGNIGTFLEYQALLLDLPKKWKDMLSTCNGTACVNDVNDSVELKPLEIIDGNVKVASVLYKYIIEVKAGTYDHGKFAWQLELKEHWDKNDWESIRLHVTSVTPSTKLHYFQFRVLSKKLTTNYVRSKWDRNVSPLCHFCERQPETIIHLLWECEIVNAFWQKILRWLRYIYVS